LLTNGRYRKAHYVKYPDTFTDFRSVLEFFLYTHATLKGTDFVFFTASDTLAPYIT